MFRFLIVSDTIVAPPTPFIREIVNDVDEFEPGIIYLIHGIEKAMTFDGFNFLENKMTDNCYWFNNDLDLNKIIFELLPCVDNIEIVLGTVSSEIFFYLEIDKQVYAIDNNGKYYHADLRIISRFVGVDVLVENLFLGKLISWKDLRVSFIEAGYIDILHQEKSFLNFLGDTIYPLLVLYKDIYESAIIINYDIDDEYNNPYLNIIFVEDLLNNLHLNNINIDKCEDYDLKYDKLPASWVFNGLHNTTGRIFASSDNFFNLQSLPELKRDVLYAPPGNILIEIDFKSFEYDILCQEIGMSIVDDPHTTNYDKFVGIPYINARKLGKTINYAFIYGMNFVRLAEAVMEELPGLDQNFKDTFIQKLESSELSKGTKLLEERILKNSGPGWILNKSNRKIYYKKNYAILNNYISSTASDFLYNKIRHVNNIIQNKGQLLLQNHDSVLFMFPINLIENTDIIEQILFCFREPWNGLVGRVEMKYGYDWGHMK